MELIMNHDEAKKIVDTLSLHLTGAELDSLHTLYDYICDLEKGQQRPPEEWETVCYECEGSGWRARG